jgi:hypothetical protein
MRMVVVVGVVVVMMMMIEPWRMRLTGKSKN